ncbi:uncharacterized protein NPIL_309761 [Nephila pilipes]|uniref:Uncharacterized protein n=1 Tax=Nephila pilipes TaxID=299642 RepID=A0A8X6UDV7_NEPPI|nr:uncharacterized protein NPIL_309761 [Nephila pilipes]
MFLNQHPPMLWIGQTGDADNVFCSWPLRSPGLILCSIFLQGFVKNIVHAFPVLKTIVELKMHISIALALVTSDMLQNVWYKMDYHLDFVHVTDAR